MKERVTIGMILDNSFPPDPRVENEAMRLKEEGFKVVLWCIDFTGKQQLVEEYKGILVVRYQTGNWLRSISALAYSFSIYHRVLQKPLLKFLQEYNIDIIHVHDIRIARPIFKINKKRLPIVLDLHENRPEIMKFYGYVKSFPGNVLISPKRWRTMEHRYLLEADASIVVTEEAKKHYCSVLPSLEGESMVVVPNSVRSSFYKGYNSNQTPSLDEDFDLHIVYIGETGERRGLATVIEAISLLKKQGVRAGFTIVGKSNYDIVLKELAVNLDVQDQVFFEGWQSSDLIADYIVKSDVGISPLHRNLHHDTTYANKIFQYMSISKAIVVSDCTTQQHIAEDYNCGVVFEAENAEDLTVKLNELIADKDSMKLMGANGRKAIEAELNWEKQSIALITLYNRLEEKVTSHK